MYNIILKIGEQLSLDKDFKLIAYQPRAVVKLVQLFLNIKKKHLQLLAIQMLKTQFQIGLLNFTLFKKSLI